MKNPVLKQPRARRRFLVDSCRFAATCLCLPVVNLLSGCVPRTEDAAAEPLQIPLEQLPLGRRRRFAYGGRPVEVIRTADGVTARSLLCTHQGCNVRWLEDEQVYLCPCHDGKFDAAGRPIYGPPRRALEVLPATVTATQVIVGG
jgi:cytochrome b6-f complex iron-sulfur subunit